MRTITIEKSDRTSARSDWDNVWKIVISHSSQVEFSAKNWRLTQHIT